MKTTTRLLAFLLPALLPELLSVLLALPLAAQEASKKAAGQEAPVGKIARFDPARAFPRMCLAYLHVPSGKALVETLGKTLPGRIASDPQVHQALGNLPMLALMPLRMAAMPVTQVTGVDPLELLTLLSGELAVSVTGIDPRGQPLMVAALELGEKREKILEVVERVSKHLAGPDQPAQSTVEVAGIKAQVWDLPGGHPPIYHIVLGTHLVFASSVDVLRGMVKNLEAGAASVQITLGGNPSYRETEAAVKLVAPRLFLFVNVEPLRSMAMAPLTRDGGSPEVVQALEASGLLSITSLGYALGERDGEIEGKAFLGTGRGATGLLARLIDAMERPSDPAPALPALPPGTEAVGVTAINGGKVLAALDRYLREGLPAEVAQAVDPLVKQVLEKTGLSMDKDLFALGRLELFLAQAGPAAGGLLPDGVFYARTEQVAPYLKVAGQLAGALGIEPQKIEGPRGQSISWLRAGSVFTRLLGMPPEPPPDGLLVALAQPPIAVAHADLEGGWTVLAHSPQEVWRALAPGPGAGTSAVGGPLAARLAREQSGARAAVTFRPRHTFLAIYNTFVNLVAAVEPYVAQFTGPVTLDLSILPPGEKFLGTAGEGFLRVEAGPEGIVLHGHRVFSSASLWGFLGLKTAALWARGLPWDD